LDTQKIVWYSQKIIGYSLDTIECSRKIIGYL